MTLVRLRSLVKHIMFKVDDRPRSDYVYIAEFW
jgi:hypothetical protein